MQVGSSRPSAQAGPAKQQAPRVQAVTVSISGLALLV
jgi:hypothetical protein